MEEVKTLEINGKDCFLVDSISDDGIVYHYFSNLEDANDIYVFKDKEVDGEDCFVSLGTESEFNYALSVFFNKHKDDKFDGATD